MTIQSPRWRPSKRLLFVLAVVLVNGALALWFLLPSAETSPPIEQQEEAAKQFNREPILFKKRVQEHLREESVAQSIEHLSNFDDTAPSLEAAMGNTIMGQHQYIFAVRYYPCLNRVRKIVEEARGNPSGVTPILKDKLAHALDDYKRIVKQYWDRANSPDPLIKSDWDEFEKRRISISCSTYLLAHFGASDSLPLLAKLFIDQGKTDKLFAKGDWKIPFHPDYNAVVNRVFLFCAMHQLARNHSRDKLWPQALKRLDEYLEASKGIPTFEVVSVPSWRATYEAWDYRITILGKDMGMDKQPHIRIHRFPEEMCLQEEPYTAVPKPQVMKWFAKMKMFIDEVYPAATKPAPQAKGASK